MTLIIADETGKKDAESYIAVADADDYVAKWYGSLAAWDDLAEAGKERSLRVATRFIDSHKFRGYRTIVDQALAWPRVISERIDGQMIDVYEIPQAIKSAAIEAAVKDTQGETLFPDHDGGTVKSESSSVGPLSTSKKYNNTKKNQKVFEVIKRLLEPLLAKNDPVARGIC